MVDVRAGQDGVSVGLRACVTRGAEVQLERCPLLCPNLLRPTLPASAPVNSLQPEEIKAELDGTEAERGLFGVGARQVVHRKSRTSFHPHPPTHPPAARMARADAKQKEFVSKRISDASAEVVRARAQARGPEVRLLVHLGAASPALRRHAPRRSRPPTSALPAASPRPRAGLQSRRHNRTQPSQRARRSGSGGAACAPLL